jgi:hypothetical protein
MRTQRPSEAEELAEAWPKIHRWLVKTRNCGPLSCLEVLSLARTRRLLRLCDERTLGCGRYVRAVRRAHEAGVPPTQSHPEWRQCAEMICHGAAEWQPCNHELCPRGARRRAVSLLMIGGRLAERHTSLLDVWVHRIMPLAVERHRYGEELDPEECDGEEALLYGKAHTRTTPPVD